ncbi:MAG: T9SS type A sorting domain-containing protein, partial [Dokdonia sp.]|nr:T9SS type A sorting domain-containing protein [Dokdonia sp.]
AGNVSVCTFNLTVDATLSVNDLALDNALSIYPNPTANVFTLTNGSGASLETMTIVDVNGRIIDTISLTEMDTEKEISIANYATGIYFARISSENATTVKRIVKQ